MNLSPVKFLVEERLGWGEGPPAKPTYASSAATTPNPLVFRADLPEDYLKVIPNDWPYSGIRYTLSPPKCV